MAKANIISYKKYLSTLNEAQAKTELEMLFSKVPQVREFYTDMRSVDSETEKAPTPKMIEDIKKKIYNQFWTRLGNPKTPNNVDIRRYISEFEKKGFAPKYLVELLMYRVEMATKYADEYGGMSESSYNSAVNAFEKAVKLIHKHELKSDFLLQYNEIIRHYNLDGYYIEQMKDIWEEHLSI